MHTSNVIKKIILLLVICGVFFSASQISFAVSMDVQPKTGVVIGFIDSGIAAYNLDASHVLEGRNYVIESNDTIDRIGHGTKTAGMVLGSADGSLPGTFPDAYVVPLVVVDKYVSGVTANGGTKALTAAILDAVDVFDCDIINISLSTVDNTEELKAAVDYAYSKGVLIVCAAGNTPNSAQDFYPAHYDNVITVGSSEGSSIAFFSASGDADFFYEGKNVSVVNYRSGKVSTVDSGTSFSCASVSGICAGWLAEDPDLTIYEIRKLLSRRCEEGTLILKNFNADDYMLTSEEKELFCRDIYGMWYQTAVEYALDNGLVNPYSENIFKPDLNADRAAVVYALYQLSGAPDVTFTSDFNDVPENAWYSKAVAWAEVSGIVSGYTNGNFGPEDDITREQLCTVFCQYAAFEGIVLPRNVEKSAFADSSSISAYAKAYVEVCQQAGIVSGKPGGIFDPKGNATRAQLCAMLMNFTE